MSSLVGQRRWRTFRNVIYSLRTSVILTVALVPPLIDQVFRMLDKVPAWVVTAVLVCGLVVLSGFATRQERRLQRVARDDGSIVTIANPGVIRAVVCTIGNLKPKAPAPLQALAEHLPKLRAAHLIFSAGTDAEAVKAELRSRLDARGFSQISLDSVTHRIDPNQVSEEDIAALELELRALRRPGLVVDITGGTKVMTMAAHQAAQRAGLPISYIIQREDQAYAGLSALSDPDELFASSGDIGRGDREAA